VCFNYLVLEKEGTVKFHLYAKCVVYLTNANHIETGATIFVENFHCTKLRRNAWVRNECRANYSFILNTLPVQGTRV